MDVTKFRGLNSVSDPMRLDMSWLVKADNVHITDSGAIAKRDGYVLSRAGSFLSAYNTLDFSRLYLVDGNVITTFDGTAIDGILDASHPMYWAEVNEQVFFNNGIDSGVILPDNSVLPWRWEVQPAPVIAVITGSLPAGTYQARCTTVLPDGRETGTSDPAYLTIEDGFGIQLSGMTPGCNVYITPADSEVYQLAGTATSTSFTFNTGPDDLGRDLLNAFLDPLPLGTDVIQFWKGRAYAAQFMPSENQTVIWFSEPIGYHLFNLNSNFIIVPGKVEMLAPHSTALVIGTDARVFAYDGQKLEQMADYGVVPGQHWALDGERILFWSTRGLVSAFPFQNITEKQVSVAPGVRAGGCLVRQGGQVRYVAAIQSGGNAFNAL